MNNTRVAQFTHARVNEAISLSELAVEVILPSDPDSSEDADEQEQESLEVQKDLDPKGHAERVLALGRRIQRRGSKKLMNLRTVQFTYDSVSLVTCKFYCHFTCNFFFLFYVIEWLYTQKHLRRFKQWYS